MKWLLLLTSILFEVSGTTMLKLAGRGTGHLVAWSLGATACYVVCFFSMGLAMRLFPLGAVYGMWAGGGVMLVAIIGVLYFGDEMSVLKVLSFVLIAIGIIGLNTGGVSH